MSAEHGKYLAHRSVSKAQIDAWVEQFHRDGFLFLKNVLPPVYRAPIFAPRGLWLS